MLHLRDAGCIDGKEHACYFLHFNRGFQSLIETENEKLTHDCATGLWPQGQL